MSQADGKTVVGNRRQSSVALTGAISVAFLACALIGVTGCKKTTAPPAKQTTQSASTFIRPTQQPVISSNLTSGSPTSAVSTTSRTAASSLDAKWKTEWASISKGSTTKTARLMWPSAIPADATTDWAKSSGDLGKTKAQILKLYKKPSGTIANKSTGAELLLYKSFSIALHDGKCVGRAPRSANYEKFFAQPADPATAAAKAAVEPAKVLTQAK